MQINDAGRLPAGKHRCSLDDMESLFVKRAPHSEHRASLLTSFKEWHKAILELVPDHTLWIDGGFVTYKDEPPQDIDVVVVARNRESLNSLKAEEQAKLQALLTHVAGDDRVIQKPMGGAVDAYIAFRSDPDNTSYWFEFWQGVRDDDTARKGFLEVIPSG